jgi:DNA methyltransferase 1-associated protein 1
LTSAEIAEEEALYVEVKRMEQNERRYRVDRDSLMRTIIGLDSGLLPVEPMVNESIWGIDRVGAQTSPSLIVRIRNADGLKTK